MVVSNRNLLFQGSIFRVYVKLLEGNLPRSGIFLGGKVTKSPQQLQKVRKWITGIALLSLLLPDFGVSQPTFHSPRDVSRSPRGPRTLSGAVSRHRSYPTDPPRETKDVPRRQHPGWQVHMMGVHIPSSEQSHIPIIPLKVAGNMSFPLPLVGYVSSQQGWLYLYKCEFISVAA